MLGQCNMHAVNWSSIKTIELPHNILGRGRYWSHMNQAKTGPINLDYILDPTCVSPIFAWLPLVMQTW